MSEDIFNEIKRDASVDKYLLFLKNNKVFVIMAILLLAVGLSFGAWWKLSIDSNKKLQSDILYSAIEDENASDIESALVKYKKIDRNFITNKATSQISMLREANLLLKQGKTKEAQSLYLEISNNKRVDVEISQLADLLYITSVLNVGGKYDEGLVNRKLDNLSKKGNTWSFSALEIKAIYAIEKGNNDVAISIFNDLLNNSKLPYNMRIRVKKMLETISVSS